MNDNIIDQYIGELIAFLEQRPQLEEVYEVILKEKETEDEMMISQRVYPDDN